MPENNNKTSDQLLAEMVESLGLMGKELAQVVSLLYTDTGNCAEGQTLENWKQTKSGMIFSKYLDLNPFACENTETVLAKAKEQAVPELYELVRIEQALTCIVAQLAVITGAQPVKIDGDFPYDFDANFEDEGTMPYEAKRECSVIQLPR